MMFPLIAGELLSSPSHRGVRWYHITGRSGAAGHQRGQNGGGHGEGDHDRHAGQLLGAAGINHWH